MLSVEQQDEFARSGILRIAGAIAPKQAKEMCDVIWSALLRRYEIRRNAPDTWKARRISGMHDLPKSETFAQIGSPQVREALDDLLGRRNWEPPERWGSLLVTFPESRDRWDVPRQADLYMSGKAASRRRRYSFCRGITSARGRSASQGKR